MSGDIVNNQELETTVFSPHCLCFAAFPTNKPDKDARHVIKVVSITLKFMFHIHLTFLFSVLFHFCKNVSHLSLHDFMINTTNIIIYFYIIKI